MFDTPNKLCNLSSEENTTSIFQFSTDSSESFVDKITQKTVKFTHIYCNIYVTVCFDMMIGDISDSISSKLVQQMKDLAGSFENFPFHIQFRGLGRNSREDNRDKFVIYWTTKENIFGTPEFNDIVSTLQCQLVGLHDGHVLLKVTPKKNRRYLGQDDRTEPMLSGDTRRNWYKQEWRGEQFLVEASASALWTIMEAHANFEKQVLEVMNR